MTRTRGLWAHADYLKLWSGQTISVFGSLVGRIALPMMVVLVLNATPMQVGVLRAVEVAPGLLAGLFAGLWVDRLRRRPLMIWADIGRAVLTGAIPVLYIAHMLTMNSVYLIACLLSLFTILFEVAYEAYLPGLVEPELLVEANSKLAATLSVAEVTGFGISGAMVQLLTAPLTILIDAVSFVFSALSLLWIRTPERRPERSAEQAGAWSEVRLGLTTLAKHPLLRSIAVVDGLDSLFGNVIGTVFMLFVLRELRLSPALSGVIFAIGGISSFFGAMLAGPAVRALGLGPALIGGQLLGAIAVAFMPLARGPLPLIVACLVAQQLVGDGALTLYAIQSTSLRQAITPGHLLGRVGATLRVSNWTFTLFGTLLGGVLGEVIGLRGALWVAFGGKLLATLWLWLTPVRSLRQIEAPAE